MTTPDAAGYSLTSPALARRLERAEAQANAAFVEARAAHAPASGAGWIDVDGTYAMFDGPASPITQTFGLGLFAPPDDAALDRLERFFADRGAEVMHEVCPLADPALLAMLSRRGYRPVELTTVLHGPIAAVAAREAAGEVRVRRMEPGEEDTFADIAARGWSTDPRFLGMVRDFALIGARRQGAVGFFAEIGGVPVATGSVALHDGVALLAGASTLPEHRRRGAQGALLGARLRYAANAGADLAMMGALPGSSSQQNAERQGFRVAYTRIKWGRTLAVATA